MPDRAVLITGAAGEIGHGLVHYLADQADVIVVTLDLQPLDDDLAPLVAEHYSGSVVDDDLLARVFDEHDLHAVYHLAALLSTTAGRMPLLAHEVNVEGTLKLLELSQQAGERHGHELRFLYPSSIAAHGLPSLAAKAAAGRVKEGEWLNPATMYGCNKLYCEQLGAYYAQHYKQLAETPPTRWVDFRSIRFPGLISAVTMPTGGTSDYAPEMIHAAARGEPYDCFVRPDTRIPFMAMPDGVAALVQLAEARREALSQPVYAITAFNPSAAEIRSLVLDAFPNAQIGYDVDHARQAVVDTWPADVDDSAARRDWGLDPVYDLQGAFDDYLIPTIRARYRDTAPA
ncbi:MAG: NAD-dependent epimerase/dehydratase family protein [Anaerolineae bacterium]